MASGDALQLLGGGTELLLARESDRLHELLYLLFKRRDLLSLRLQLFVFRTGYGHHFRVACRCFHFIFHE